MLAPNGDEEKKKCHPIYTRNTIYVYKDAARFHIIIASRRLYERRSPLGRRGTTDALRTKGFEYKTQTGVAKIFAPQHIKEDHLTKTVKSFVRKLPTKTFFIAKCHYLIDCLETCGQFYGDSISLPPQERRSFPGNRLAVRVGSASGTASFLWVRVGAEGRRTRMTV